ncbi:MAG TPA: TM2 domain-containing protein [Telluria sp.]|nr:TM2 domain-containing protein [Telluria sp.]
MPTHRNKSFATLLALVAGSLGAHRFYLRKSTDRLGLLHLCSVPVCGLVYGLAPHADPFYKVLPLLVSGIAAFIEALVIGLMADEKFDATYNPDSGQRSESGWPLAVLLVATAAIGATVAIATISRLFDLLYTGGAYG